MGDPINDEERCQQIERKLKDLNKDLAECSHERAMEILDEILALEKEYTRLCINIDTWGEARLQAKFGVGL